MFLPTKEPSLCWKTTVWQMTMDDLMTSWLIILSVLAVALIVLPLSEIILRGSPLRAVNRLKHQRKAGADRLGTMLCVSISRPCQHMQCVCWSSRAGSQRSQHLWRWMVVLLEFKRVVMVVEVVHDVVVPHIFCRWHSCEQFTWPVTSPWWWPANNTLCVYRLCYR